MKPKAPPLLEAMAALKERLEAKRKEIFPLWQAALKAADGNIHRAGREYGFGTHELLQPYKGKGREPALGPDTSTWITRRLGLLDYARALRVKAGLKPGPGRPKGSGKG